MSEKGNYAKRETDFLISWDSHPTFIIVFGLTDLFVVAAASRSQPSRESFFLFSPETKRCDCGGELRCVRQEDSMVYDAMTIQRHDNKT